MVSLPSANRRQTTRGASSAWRRFSSPAAAFGTPGFPGEPKRAGDACVGVKGRRFKNRGSSASSPLRIETQQLRGPKRDNLSCAAGGMR